MLRAKNQQTNIALFTLVISLLIIIGLIFIYSASSAYAIEKFGNAHYFVKKQLIGLVIGIAGLFFFKIIPFDWYKKLTPTVFFACLFITTLPLVPKLGFSINGSKRWIFFKGISFQPSELLKIAFILYIAYLITKKKHYVNSFINGFLPILCVIGATALILLKQPDFGQTVTLATTALILFFIAECRLQHMLYIAACAIPALSALIYTKPYRIKRVLTFLNPWDDPQGAGFQIIQSLIAIGSGNIKGVGIAQSQQKFFYLPMQHTDFIFSIIAEETGFIGSAVLISLYVSFLYMGIKIARTLNDEFAYYAVLGFILLISLQTIINLFVATGLLPTKGLGLPFISYGNSALMCNLFMVGIILNFINNKKATILNPTTLHRVFSKN